MNRRIAMALLSACLISAGCTYLLGRKLKLASSSRNQQMFRYVAPSRALEAGETLRTEDLDWASWPRESPIAGALVSVAGIPGRVVLYPIGKGQPILEHDLADAGTGGGLASRIPKGMRALALRSDDVVGVAGFLAPGSRLDVLVTYRANNSEEPVTATVLENAEVLAAGQRLEPDPSGKPASATVVTLLLTPVAAERAVLASTQGTIHFILRNGLDKDESTRAPMSMAGLALGNSAAVVPLILGPPLKPPARSGRSQVAVAANPRNVETILGGDHGGEGKQP